MASDKECGLEITNEFKVMGSIDHMKSGKGKKLVLTITVDDSSEIVNINNSIGCVCIFNVAVSKKEDLDGYEQDPDQLSFDEIAEEDE